MTILRRPAGHSYCIKTLIYVYTSEYCLYPTHAYLNNKMFSLVIHAGYEGGDIEEKIHNPR